MEKTMDRRSALHALIVGTGALALARVVGACADDAQGGPRLAGERAPAPTPTDDDEFVPDPPKPVETGDTPPSVPNAVWEARARQLEDEQKRVAGAVYTAEAPGKWAGKERSHVPQATVGRAGRYDQVTVVVQHVMGANGLDAGAVDAAYDARASGADASRADAGDAGATDAATDAGPAVPAQVHYITTIYVRAAIGGKSTVVGLWEFASTDAAPPAVTFTLPEGVTSVVAYEYCTLHGLWASAPLAV